MWDPQFSCEECMKEGLEEASGRLLLRDHGGGVGSGSRPVCLLTPGGSFSGPLCEQHVGVRERHVPRQPLRPVLLPACLSADADGHCCEPPPGRAPAPSGLSSARCLCFPEGMWGPSGSILAHFSMNASVSLTGMSA